MTPLRQHTETAAAALKQWFPDGRTPDVFVQTGSGMAPRTLLDDIIATMPLEHLTGMPSAPSPAGHELNLCVGTCGANRILLANGRRHLYEGKGTLPCVLPVCAAAAAGIRSAVLLCTAGGIGTELSPGTVMLATDYINNLGVSPLVGATALGENFFVDVSEAFSQYLISSFINTASEHGMFPRLGVYQANLGPQYETPSEVELARQNGADAVGMSMVPETIAAHALGCSVLGLALITNRAARRGSTPLTHDDVVQTADAVIRQVGPVLRAWLASDDLAAGA